MKEIGGYLELDDFVSREYYPELLHLNTARNALVYLCRARNIRKLWLPYFLCDSVADACSREKIAVAFYNIDSAFAPILPETWTAGDWLYLVNYYGQLTDDQIHSCKAKYKNIILDNVQAFFAKPLPGVDTLYSCRKFFGVPDGAYLATEAADIPLQRDVSKDRMKHILGRFEGTSASDYYADFKENDHSFRDLPLMAMSRLTQNLLGALDYEKIRTRRNANWERLHGALNRHNRLQLISPDGPYMYPFYCENGMQIKKKLAAEKIFIPTLWPNVLTLDGCGQEKDYAQNILPLPVDQRYDEQDMDRIASAILRYVG